MRRFSIVLVAQVVALAWPAYAAPAAPAAAQPWSKAVRCAAIVERMPEVMAFTVRIMDAAALTNPALAAQLPKLKQSMQDAGPAMLKVGEFMREEAKAEVVRSHPGWAAGASGSDRTLTADALFEREMVQARQAYADIRFETIDEATTAGMRRLQADVKTYCEIGAPGG